MKKIDSILLDFVSKESLNFDLLLENIKEQLHENEQKKRATI